MTDLEIDKLKELHKGRDTFEHPDFYKIDDLLSEEHLMVRDTVRSYVKRELSPIIEACAQNNYFPKHIVKQLGEVGCFGPQIPVEHWLLTVCRYRIAPILA